MNLWPQCHSAYVQLAQKRPDGLRSHVKMCPRQPCDLVPVCHTSGANTVALVPEHRRRSSQRCNRNQHAGIGVKRMGGMAQPRSAVSPTDALADHSLECTVGSYGKSRRTRVQVCVRAYVCARACVCVRVRACVRVSTHAHTHVRA